MFTPILTGGGNLYSTVEDLGRWSEALRAHALVSDDSYRAMYTPEREQYGYGWVIADFEGRQLLRHGGSVPGFLAQSIRIPSEGYTLVMLTNVTPTNLGELALSVASVMFEGGVRAN
jgi:CubicO group peptidase (beta-lactamase class C family)